MRMRPAVERDAPALYTRHVLASVLGRLDPDRMSCSPHHPLAVMPDRHWSHFHHPIQKSLDLERLALGLPDFFVKPLHLAIAQVVESELWGRGNGAHPHIAGELLIL